MKERIFISEITNQNYVLKFYIIANFLVREKKLKKTNYFL